jgi:hypothetical protein
LARAAGVEPGAAGIAHNASARTTSGGPPILPRLIEQQVSAIGVPRGNRLTRVT